MVSKWISIRAVLLVLAAFPVKAEVVQKEDLRLHLKRANHIDNSQSHLNYLNEQTNDLHGGALHFIVASKEEDENSGERFLQTNELIFWKT